MSRFVILVLLAGVCYQYIQKYMTRLPVHYDGYCAPGWERVGQLFKEKTENGAILGGTFNVYHKGEPVVNIWGGYADDEMAIPWTEKTLSHHQSVTKATAAVVLHVLVDRGLIDTSQPVIKYWPEFGQNGKEKITVNQILSHQAGLAYLDQPYTFDTMKNNPDKIGELFAAQKPQWNDRTQIGYHALSIGLLIDQLVRRVDTERRPLHRFFHEEIAEPFGIDFYVGLPLAENYRMARIYVETFSSLESLSATKYWPFMYASQFDSTGFLSKYLHNHPDIANFANYVNDPIKREVPLASANGFGTGSSMAKLMGILANGGVSNGQHLLSTSGIEALGTPLASGFDLFPQFNRTVGPGTDIQHTPDGGSSFGHPGWGGQLGYADPAHSLGWSYITNHYSVYHFGIRPHTEELKQMMYECVLDLEKLA